VFTVKAVHTPVELKTNYQKNPLGIDSKNPRLSWKIKTDEKGFFQSAYQVRAAESVAELSNGRKLLWDSGKITSDNSIEVYYDGDSLMSRQRVYWQVRVWNTKDEKSAWSMPVFFEMGLLSPGDWQAEMIIPQLETLIERADPSPYLRKSFKIEKPVEKARLYITTNGIYDLSLNGEKVTDNLFAPGWTTFRKRWLYQTYDVTGLLNKGENVIGIVIGDGYSTFFQKKDREVYYILGAFAQLEITYKDGHTQKEVTDESWKANIGPVLLANYYDGQDYDATKELGKWYQPGYDDKNWKGVKPESTFKKSLLQGNEAPFMSNVMEVDPVALLKTPKGETVIDFGQNLVGVVRSRLQAPRGTKMKLIFGEMLDKEGNFYNDNYRQARGASTYVFKGEGTEEYEPRLMFCGFRYAKVEGLKDVSPAWFKAVVRTSAKEQTGTFSCSDTLINKLHNNIVWSFRGNYMDLPIDCPQRDERYGWSCDVQLFASTACYLADVNMILERWVRELQAGQFKNGSFPMIAPDMWGDSPGDPGWGDAGIIVPWELYKAYGNKSILNELYDNMKAWSVFCENSSTNELWTASYWGSDWLAYASKEAQYQGAYTDKYLIADAYTAISTRLLSQIAQVLDKPEDSQFYKDLYRKRKDAFIKEYITENGRLASNTQTAYVLALYAGLFPDHLVDQAVNRLVDDIHSFGFITCGFLGAPLINDVLTQYNRVDVAFKLLFNEKYPSWLYQVKSGATTMWERWDGLKPDRTFQDSSMNSFNHTALGSIGHWIYRNIGGIQNAPESAGYKHIIINPVLSSRIYEAQSSFDSVYGTIYSHWKIEGNKYTHSVTVPPNTFAEVYLPNAGDGVIYEGSRPVEGNKLITRVGKKDGKTVLKIGSGEYFFTSSVALQDSIK